MAQLFAFEKLAIGKHFDALDDRDKSYVHYLSRAAWYGSRIILHQTSPEANDIFDFVLELNAACSGDWKSLAAAQNVPNDEMQAFLRYAAAFLANVGNYYGGSGEKFTPSLAPSSLGKLANSSERAQELWAKIEKPIFALPPFRLGFPGEFTQSAYYPESELLTSEESHTVLSTLVENHIWPENIRIQKQTIDGQVSLRLLQASEEFDPEPKLLKTTSGGINITLERGDLDSQLWMVCRSLNQATRFVAGSLQQRMLYLCQKGIESGDLNLYRESLKLWLHDRTPRIEQVFGFVRPHRDPGGTKAEFQGIVGVSDPVESQRAQQLVVKSKDIIQQLPWVVNTSDEAPFGPFEKVTFEGSGCICINIVSYSSSRLSVGMTLPSYDDIREGLGCKSLIMLNLASATARTLSSSPYLRTEDRQRFSDLSSILFHQFTVLQEVFGRSTGRLMREVEPGTYTFNQQDPPIDPATSLPIAGFYKHGETFAGVFQDLATTIDACRAELVAVTLMHDAELQAVFHQPNNDTQQFDDILYHLYNLLGVKGLEALKDYNVHTKNWGSAGARAHFAILVYLLENGNDALMISEQADEDAVPQVLVDRGKLGSHGKSALSKMLLKLHMFRCTANVAECRAFYSNLTAVEGRYEVWHAVVNKHARVMETVFIQPNTVLEGKKVGLREYEGTIEGLIASWADRQI